MHKCYCIKCNIELTNITSDGFHPLDGLVFSTYGHYGSSYFDPMDSTSLQIVICDHCMSALPTTHVFWSIYEKS